MLFLFIYFLFSCYVNRIPWQGLLIQQPEPVPGVLQGPQDGGRPDQPERGRLERPGAGHGPAAHDCVQCVFHLQLHWGFDN